MLDNLQKIHERDRDDMLGIVASSYRQLETNFSFTPGYEPNDVLNVVFAAMGGSAVAATMVSAWPTIRVPFEVVRDYEIPVYVGRQTLFIACSYSGNTEETIEALERAAELGAQIVVIAVGGKLMEIAKEKGYPFALLPEVRQPRFATLYNLRVLTTVLQAAGLCSIDQEELSTAAEFLHRESEVWLPTVATKHNFAKQTALECMGKSVVVYAGPKLASAAYKWKIGINKSAKQLAWWNVLPEFNHNEFTGWSKQPIEKLYEVIELRSTLEHLRIQKRFEASERLLSGMRPAPFVIDVHGETVLQQLLWSIVLGDFVGIYLGMLNGLDPAPLDLVDKLKRALNE